MRLGYRARCALVLVLGTFALYARTATYDFVWDDTYQITENRSVTEGVSFMRYFLDSSTTTSRPDFNSRIYRPLRNIAFRGIAATFGVHPLPFRLANIATYGACTAFLFLLLCRVLQDDRAALFGAAFWGVLSVHVEVVAFPSALGDALSLAFALTSLLAALSAIDDDHSTTRRWLLGAASVVFAFCAMSAKEMAITQVALLAAMLACFPGLARRDRRVTTAIVLGQAAVTLAFFLLRSQVIGRIGQEDSSVATLLRGVMTAPVALNHYVGIMLMPIGHQPSYMKPPITAPWFAAHALLIAAVLALTWYGERGRRARPLVCGLAWIIVGLSPVLHLVPVWAFIADRFAFAPSIGVAIVAGAALKIARDRHLRIMPAVVIVFVAYAGGTLLEQSKWRNNLSIFTHDAMAAPDSEVAQTNACVTLLKEGDTERALAACTRAGELGSTNPQVYIHQAVALEAANRLDEALQAVRKALQLDPKSPAAWAALGSLHLLKGEQSEAARALQAAESHGFHPNVLMLRAELATARNDRVAAFASFDELVSKTGAVARVHFMYARAAAKLGDEQRTRREIAHCLTLDPAAAPCRSLLESLPP